ncbi:hypothetical protein OEZ85_003258 [Tetradesmus obliquus]|uniref:N-acetyltransferase domain-containing protein n=1 Tax=Tetradesmus obliquus TaxID=3088 RepID=A0ABY8U073_TETOB|nr:hypothetical protein OEZ85_003258 [Tetradesmus obliquus]
MYATYATAFGAVFSQGGVADAAQPLWKQLDFDSKVFKFPVASISADVTLSDMQPVLEKCAANGMHLAYWAPNSIPTGDLPEWFTGFAAASNVLLRRSVSPSDIKPQPPASFSLASVPLGPPARALIELGFTAGQRSRFHADPSLTQPQFERLYTAWVENCTQRRVADEVLAAYEHSDGAAEQPLGFITIKLPQGSNTASIGLLAVSPACQRRGVGAALMQSAVAWAAAAGAQQLEVVTQADNAPALAFYAFSGFEQVSSTTIYHIWLEVQQRIRQNVPYFTGSELRNLSSAMEAEEIRSCGPFSTDCQCWMEQHMGTGTVLLTSAGTTALEQAALLCDFQPGDEVIMPSYTFVSTANAFVLRGATPVFVDVRGDTLNMDISTIVPALSERTRAIVVVHYAGVAVDMDPIMELARERGLLVVEDNAHGFLSTYKGRALGTIGHFGCLSFHYTKNIICGEGGALLVNDAAFRDRAHITWEKGTNRFDFINKKVDKYEWIDLGSSFVPSELVGAFLHSQLLEAEAINARRRRVSKAYHQLLQPLEASGAMQLMPLDDGTGNGHIFWIMLPSKSARDGLAKALGAASVEVYGHYVPLHLSPGGQKWGRAVGDMQHTVEAGAQLLRLPLWPHMTCVHVHQVVKAVCQHMGADCPSLSQVLRLFAAC